VKVMLYGWISEEVGQREIDTDLTNIDEILGLIGLSGKSAHLIFVVNHSKIVDKSYILKDGDTLAILPIPSGG